jgi:hypothetical protein
MNGSVTIHRAARRILGPAREIRMDYGTYSFSFDHELHLHLPGRLGMPAGRLRGTTGKSLVRMGLRHPPGFNSREAEPHPDGG